METSFRWLARCYWSRWIQRKEIQLLVTSADTRYNMAANKIGVLFSVSVDVGRCQDSFCWTERTRKHIPGLRNDVFISYTTRAITTFDLVDRHVVYGVGRCRTLSELILLKRATLKTCTSLWNDVFISYTARVITTFGLACRHVSSGVGQYRLNLVYVSFLPVNTWIAKGPHSGM
jgi:hypothetical protein